MYEHLIEKEITDTGIIAQYTKRIATEGSKAFELMETVANNYDTWPVSKSNRWIGYAQCILVAEGRTTIDALRSDIRSIIEGES